MKPINILFYAFSEHAILPTKNHATDSGLDLYAAEDTMIYPGQTVVVPTDIGVVLPPGHEAQVRPRSGITSSTKLRVQLGTIDELYRGPIGIIVDNIAPVSSVQYSYPSDLLGDYVFDYEELTEDKKYPLGTYLIQKGDKLAQLVVQPIPCTVASWTNQLDNTERGANGFGSSGTSISK